MSVYKAMQNVMRDLCKTGIAKGDWNKFDKYNFRGIDSVLNTLSPLLSKHGLLILPEVKNREEEDRPTQKGGTQIRTVVYVDYILASSDDGSTHTVTVVGEGMDRSDKSLNKALTNAYKNMVFQVFCAPTIAIDVEDDKHQADAVAARSYTDQEKQFLDRFIETGDATRYLAWWVTLDDQKKNDLYNSFEKGQITKNKERMKSLENEGRTMIDNCAEHLREAIQSDDDAGILEIKQEMELHEKKLVAELLTVDEIKKLTEVK